MSNWNRIDHAPKGMGPMLLRAGAGALDPVYMGLQADDGRWLYGDQQEVHPTHFCLIPQFDADDDASAA